MTRSEKLDEFLKKNGAMKRRACKVCENAPLAEALAAFLEKKARGETDLALEWMNDNFFKCTFNGPACGSLRKHARECLKRDPTSGKRLRFAIADKNKKEE